MSGRSFFGVEIIVVPDNDERLKYVPPGHIGTNGRYMYVRASQWPAVREALAPFHDVGDVK